MRPIILCIVAGLMLAIQAPAQPSSGWTELPTVSGDPINARIFRLANGLTVMLSVNPVAPRVQTLIAVRAGSKNDPASHTGLAHYLEHMLFKGTDSIGAKDYVKEQPLLDAIERLYEQYNGSSDSSERARIYRRIDSVSGIAAQYVVPNEYDRLVSALGAGWTNAWTWYDQTVYTNSIPTNQIDRWLEIEAERFRNPMVRLFHTELEAVYEEKNISLDRDESRQEDLVFELLMPHHPYGTQTTLGTVEHLKNPSITEIRRFLERYYVPNNMAIILAGDLNVDEVIGQIAGRFGNMQPQPVPKLERNKEKPVGGVLEASVYGPDPESVMIGFRAPGNRSGDGHLLELVSQLLDYRQAGFFDLNLRQSQRVLDASARPYSFVDYGVEMIEGKPKEGQTLEEVRDLLIAEVARVRNGEFTDDQLSAVLLNRRVDDTRSFEGNSGRAYTMLDAFVPGIEWPAYIERRRTMAKVTRREIIEFAGKYLAGEYAVVYKRQRDTTIGKVPKPPITPVTLDRESVSPFAAKILARTSRPQDPAFVDFATELSTHEIASGLTLVHRGNVENDLFTLRIVFEFGRNADQKAPVAIGLLPLLGAGERTAEQVRRAFFQLGCEASFSVDDETITANLSGPDAAFEKAISILFEQLHRAIPDDRALAEMIERTLKSRQEGKLNKHRILWDALWNFALYGKQNPFNTVLSEQELRSLKAADLVAWLRGLPSYEHEVLYYGPRGADAVVSVLQRAHGDGKVVRPVPTAPVYAPVVPTEPVVYFVDMPMVQAEMIWLRPRKFDATMLPEVEVFNEYFGGGMGAVVFQTIREARALAYSTSGRMRKPDRARDPFLSFAYIGTQADKTGEAIGAMVELFTDLPRSQEAYSAALASLRNQLESERTVRAEVLDEYLKARRLGVDHDLRRDTYAALSRTSLEDVIRFHRESFADGPFALAIVGSRERIDIAALSRYGKVVQLEMRDVFGF